MICVDRMRMLASALCMATVNQAVAQPKPSRDTSIFVYQANRLTIKEHGDTVWLFTPSRTTRVIDTGERILQFRQVKGSAATEIIYEVRGAMAYPINSSTNPMKVSVLRQYKAQVQTARKAAALGLPRR